MGLKIMGFNRTKLNFMFENFPLTTIIKIIWVEMALKLMGFCGVVTPPM